MSLRLASLTAAALLALTALAAIGRPALAEEAPRAFACTFANGTARSYDKGRFKAEQASRVVFDIEAIAPDQQTAVAKRGDAATALRVVRAINGIHFLEAVSEGYLNVTTVYDRDAKATRHPAVHSRHFAVLGQPIVAQYYGFCAPKG